MTDFVVEPGQVDHGDYSEAVTYHDGGVIGYFASAEAAARVAELLGRYGLDPVEPDTYPALRRTARRQYGEEGAIEIDDDAPVSEGGDETGAYVGAWVWVEYAEADEGQDPIVCPRCEGDESAEHNGYGPFCLCHVCGDPGTHVGASGLRACRRHSGTARIEGDRRFTRRTGHLLADFVANHPDRVSCDWCGARTGDLVANGFNEWLCPTCAGRCCSTCSRGLDNPPEEHDGCTMTPLRAAS